MEWTQEELGRVCREWQRELRLEDWRIVIRFKRGREMSSRNNGGEVYVCRAYREAVINILNTADHDDFTFVGEFPMDIERTIVHELTEIHFDHFKTEEEGLVNVAQETAINMLSFTLTNLRRFHEQ